MKNRPEIADALSLWRQGKQFRWVQTRIANNGKSQSVQPIGSYFEHLHERPDRMLRIEPSGEIWCKTSDAIDFQYSLKNYFGQLPSTSFGGDFPLIPFLRSVNTSVVKQQLDGHEVYRIQGADEQADVSICLDPKLGYAARRVRRIMLKQPIRPGEKSGLSTGVYSFPIYQLDVNNFRKVGETHVPSQARLSMKKRTAPDMVVRNDIRLLDVKFLTELSADDLKLTTPIKNGTSVGMSGADSRLKFFWLNGEVVKDNGDKEGELLTGKSTFESFRVQPLVTDLQKYLSMGLSDAHVAIDGEALLNRGRFHKDDIDLTYLQDLLQLQAESNKKLEVSLRWSKYGPSDIESEKLKGELKAICEAAGFLNVRFSDRQKRGGLGQIRESVRY